MISHRTSWCLAALLGVVWSAQLSANTLWTENAESGSGFVIDNTSGSYSLIQSDIAGEGDYAFHLANPSFADNSFVIDQTLTIEPDTKLFFLSRLGYATTAQIARVQVSTNGGASWPTNIYNQPGATSGTSVPGEGSFSLKEIDLSSYSGQNVRFRFYYDFTGGSAFTQTDPGVGWYVDDIQVADQFEKIPYSIGDPSPEAQLYLEYVNRARSDALVEAERLRDETDSDVLDAYASFGIDGQDIVDQFDWYVNNGAIDQHAQPLSFQANLLDAAELHTQDMFNNQFQGHFSSSSPPSPFVAGYDPGQRMNAVGYNWLAYGENVYSNAESVTHGHDGFDVDWGTETDTGSPWYNPAFNGQGMQNPAGHRINLHNGDYKEIGIGVVDGVNGSVGPQLVTEDFGFSGEVSYITGVVYEDLNGNSFYDIGEGRSGVRIDVDGSPYFALSSASGGYSIPVSIDGTYSVTFSGGGFNTFMSDVMIAGGLNVKLDYLATAGLLGDYNGNDVIDAADYTTWRDALTAGATTLANDPTPGTVDESDFLYWRDHFGEVLGSGAGAGSLTAVPEPAMCQIVALGFVTSCILRRRFLDFAKTGV